MYPMDKETRDIRNRIEVVVVSFFVTGLLICMVTRIPMFIAVTAGAIPFCESKFGKKFIGG